MKPPGYRVQWYLKQLQARHHHCTTFSYVLSSFLHVVVLYLCIYMQKVIASIASAHYSGHRITQSG